MQLEDYFDFQSPDDIRLKGTRVGIETILYDFIHRSRTPEEIADTYRTLTLEQVYATITYYLHYRAEVDAYLTRWLEYCERSWQEAQRNPPPLNPRLQEMMRQLEAEKAAGSRRV
jgi:uncharacterized protein (DUF433 family)